MDSYLSPLVNMFETNSSKHNSIPMTKYMKNHFSFLGIKSPERKFLGQKFIKTYGLPKIENIDNIIKQLWEMPFREYQYFAQELLIKLISKTDVQIITLLEYMLTTKSWWDTVDLIAAKLVGDFFSRHSSLTEVYIDKWISSENMWLQRTTLLFQLKYKQKTNFNLLIKNINRLKNIDEFFIQKAIGWSLREYSKTVPDMVVKFVTQNNLSPLAAREALKWLNSKNNSVKQY